MTKRLLGTKISLSLLLLAGTMFTPLMSKSDTQVGAISNGPNSQVGTNNALSNSGSISNVLVESGAGLGYSSGFIAPSTQAVLMSPSAYSHTQLFHGPWNFTPPHILFHPTKTINDNSIYSRCRVVNVGAPLRARIKDYLFGIYDEKEYIASAISSASPSVPSGAIIVCGLDTNLPPSCVSYLGTGYVFMEEYATTEAALVGLARIASKNSANLVGNLNCTYAETVRSYSTGIGASIGGSATDSESVAGGTSIGATWGTTRVKRPAQPHCSGDFYVGSPGCPVIAQANFVPPPIPYKRYLPAPPAPTYAAPQQGQPVRGYW